jgi:mono/diheme cytochrome c family protein
MSGGNKNRRIVLFSAIAICLLAAGAVYADLVIGDYSSTNLGQVSQPAPPSLRPDGAYRVQAYPLYLPELAPGDGRQFVVAYCNICHSPNYVLMQPPLPAAEWEAEVHKMVNAFGANIPPNVQQQIIRYLQTNYTPETRKQ